jgi:hypothetical protein
MKLASLAAAAVLALLGVSAAAVGQYGPVRPGQFVLFPTASKTANYTLTAVDSGTFFDNTGASGSVTFTLPTETSGFNACFAVVAAQTVKVAAPGGVTITLGTTTSASGGNVQLSGIGSSLCLYAPQGATANWLAFASSGAAAVVPSLVVDIACNASINSAIMAGGGGASPQAPIVYQLAGTPGNPCTYSAPNSLFHTASNIIIQGYVDPVNNPVGAATILDGGQGSTSSNYLPITCAGPTIVGYICPTGSGANNNTPDFTANVTLQYVKVQNAGGSQTCTSSQTIAVGCYHYSGSDYENWSPQITTWDGWALQHDTFTASGGWGFLIAGNGTVVTQNLVTGNYGSGSWMILGFGGYAGSYSGPARNHFANYVTNNEYHNNDIRGDNTANGAVTCMRTESDSNYTGATLIGGGQSVPIYIANNYCHDGNAVGFWSDEMSSNQVYYTGNTIANMVTSGTDTAPADCLRIEWQIGRVDIEHNVIRGCGGAGIALFDVNGIEVKRNYVYVDKIDYSGALGIELTEDCREPGIGVTVDENVIALAKGNDNTLAVGNNDATALGTACGAGSVYPTWQSYGTFQSGNGVGNIYYIPVQKGTVAGGGNLSGNFTFGANNPSGGSQGTLPVWQNSRLPFTPPATASTVVSSGASGCQVVVSSVASGALSGGMTLVNGSNRILILSQASGTTGGAGTYNLATCPSLGALTYTGYYPGAEETASTVYEGADVTGTVSSAGVLNVTAVTTGAIVGGQSVAANDGTNGLPFGTFVEPIGSNSTTGTGSTGTYQLSQVPTPGAITSTAVWLNGGSWATNATQTTQGAVQFGCTTPITAGGCPNGSGI